ncbi:MAG TPA: S41 family peptidase [Magnetospirillaceae bacterium]|jgi:carboxyl-terminal processing protease
MIRKVLIGAVTASFIAFGAISVPQLAWAANSPTGKENNTDETYRLMKLFGDVFERVRSEYVEPVSDQELIEAAMNGMLTSLDPHSNYLNAKSFRDMQVTTKGEFGGLGIEVTMENGFVKVVSPIDDTPAAHAGLKPGDFITHIDGESVQGLALSDAVDKMRGAVNTTIKLSIRREGAAPFDVTLTRAVIKIETVKAKLIDNIGYVRLTQFAENTDSGLRKAIDGFKKDSNGKLEGIVLDLRNNPGGLLDQAVAVAGDFLDKGEIVSTRARRPEDTQRFNAHGPDLTGGLPMAVLINDGSASASEIVAGALQDHRRAILLGTRSFGKGSVQTIIPLQGYGAIRLTTARYYTPSGRSIQAVGIEPDIKVQQGKFEVSSNGPAPLRGEASLRGALRNDTLPEKKSGESGETPAPQSNAAPAGGAAPAPANAAPPADAEQVQFGDPANDYQLARAIDLLHGLSLYKGQKAAN